MKSPIPEQAKNTFLRVHSQTACYSLESVDYKIGFLQVGMPEEVVEEASRVAHSVRDGELSSVSLGAAVKQQRMSEIHSLAHKIENIARAWSANPERLDFKSHIRQLADAAKELMKG